MSKRHFWYERSGASGVIFALGAAIFIIVAAAGMDLGYLAYQARSLQGAVDLAALSAAQDLPKRDEAVQRVLALNSMSDARVSVEPGIFTNDPALKPDARFSPVATGQGINAVRVIATRPARTLLAHLILPGDGFQLKRRATAASSQLGALRIGSRALALEGGLANALLSKITGRSVRLTAFDYQALATLDLDLFGFADRLRIAAETPDDTYEAVFSRPVSAKLVFTAAADQARLQKAPSAATALDRLAQALDNRQTVRLSSLFDFGPIGRQRTVSRGGWLMVDAYALATNLLINTGGAQQVTVDLGAQASPIANVQAEIGIGEHPRGQAWLSIGEAQEVRVSTAQVRLLLRARLLSLLSPTGAVNLPLFVEIAPANAQLRSMACSPLSATVEAQTGLGRLAIGEPDTLLGDQVKLQPAILIDALALRARLDALVTIGEGKGTLQFDAADIQNKNAKTLRSKSFVSSTLGSLLEKSNLQIEVLGQSFGSALIAAGISALLKLVTAPVDALLEEVLAALGFSLGEADVWIEGARCGAPILVG